MKEENLSKEEQRRREEEERRRERLFRAIEQLIYTSYLQTLSLPAVRRAIEKGDSHFFFANNHTANKQANRVLGNMARSLNGLMLNGIRHEWEFSGEVLQRRVEAQLSSSTHDKLLRDRIRMTATASNRNRSADAFVHEKQRDGLNLSGRVWNLAGNAKKELEVIIQNAIIEGKRGTEIAKDLQGFLIEPDKLFRRVRNKETGELELSQAARDYHPGQGVYRSSYKNALRMARTELKAAQCEAAWQSAQSNPLIVGWEIRLSNNHTTLRNGKPCPFHDMCDELQGVYPKAFRFLGWHPHCRCEMLPIIARPSDRKELYRRIFKGDAKERAEWSPRKIEEVPQVFTDWVEKNRERARGWHALPRFITDNPAYIVGEYGRPKPRPVEVPPGFLDFEDPRKPAVSAKADETLAKEIRELMQRAKASGAEVQGIAEKVAKTHGGVCTPINYKSEASIKRKVENGRVDDPKYSPSDLKDAVRTTIIVGRDKIEGVIGELERHCNSFKHKAQTPDRFIGYSGHIVNLKTKNGLTAEIQVNTARMIYAKEPPEIARALIGSELWYKIHKETGLPGGLGHKLYEAYRVLDPSDEKAIELAKESMEYYKHFQD